MGKDTPVRLRYMIRGIILWAGKRRISLKTVLIECNLLCMVLSIVFCLSGPGFVYAQGESHLEISDTPMMSEVIRDRVWAEVYAESVAGQEGTSNRISDVVLKAGFHVAKLGDQDLDLYAKMRLLHDTDRNYWNNRKQAGVGVRYKPFSSLGVVLFAEYLYNDYTDRQQSEAINPDDSPYWEAEGGAVFWQWWGVMPWQVKAIHAYMPFTGWREVYGDCIYYAHNDNNAILTVDYKEGWMLGRFKTVGLDGYVSIETGADTNADEWNNYIKIGPGVRITPFSNLDLKVSVEYFAGRYLRGGFDTTGGDISELVTTVSFWYGW